MQACVLVQSPVRIKSYLRMAADEHGQEPKVRASGPIAKKGASQFVGVEVDPPTALVSYPVLSFLVPLVDLSYSSSPSVALDRRGDDDRTARFMLAKSKSHSGCGGLYCFNWLMSPCTISGLSWPGDQFCDLFDVTSSLATSGLNAARGERTGKTLRRRPRLQAR